MRTTTLRGLGGELRRFERRAERFLLETLREIGETGGDIVVDRSAVDTGRYEASHTSWIGNVEARELPETTSFPGVVTRGAFDRLRLGDRFGWANAARRPGQSSYAEHLEPPKAHSPQMPGGNYALIGQDLLGIAPGVYRRVGRRVFG